jgi:hypothetical protein
VRVQSSRGHKVAHLRVQTASERRGKQRRTWRHCSGRKERRILGDFYKYSRVFRALCVVVRNTF